MSHGGAEKGFGVELKRRGRWCTVAVEHGSWATRARTRLSKEAVDSWTGECPGCLATEERGRSLLERSRQDEV
jgi:hypothetical protein